ncbi:PLDc N-terminal domain-containing protein [Staphylococcus pseudintermedius]
MTIKILIPIIILIIIYLIVCYHDLYKINMVKYLPKWVWSIIIISIPLGGVIYFLLGRETRGENGD